MKGQEFEWVPLDEVLPEAAREQGKSKTRELTPEELAYAQKAAEQEPDWWRQVKNVPTQFGSAIASMPAYVRDKLAGGFLPTREESEQVWQEGRQPQFDPRAHPLAGSLGMRLLDLWPQQEQIQREADYYTGRPTQLLEKQDDWVPTAAAVAPGAAAGAYQGFQAGGPWGAA